MTDQANVWFIRADSHSSLLAPLRELNADLEEWSLIALSVPGASQEMSSVPSSSASNDLYRCTKAEVEERIIELVDIDAAASSQVKATSRQYLKAASRAFSDWKIDRRAGVTRKGTAGLQNFLCTIGDFLQGFSGIAEIVKAADQQFGGLAYGTISLLVSVAVHKSRREEELEDALEELAYAFPRLDVLDKVKPKDSLRALIVEVFQLVIVFCRETTAYFAQKSVARVMKALSPRELRMKTLSRLRMKLAEIRKECEVILVEEIAEMKKKLEEIQGQLGNIELTGSDTNIRVREGHAWILNSDFRARETYLSELKQILGVRSTISKASSTTLEQYKSLLTEEFSEHRKQRRAPRLMSSELLFDEEVYSNWHEKEESSLLLLGGSNMLEDSSIDVNWMSYASIIAVESAPPSTVVLSFFCQTDRKRYTFSDVVKTLIFQLAKSHPDCLRPIRDDIIDAIKSTQWRDENPDVAFEFMSEVLTKAISQYDDDMQITIVIDRLDQCRWDGNDALHKAVDYLLYIVRHDLLKHLRIKILLVMEEGAAEIVAKKMKFEKGRAVDWKTDWAQEPAEDLPD